MSGTRSGASRRWRATPSRRSCSCSGSPPATTASSPAQLLPHEGRQLGLGRGAHHPRGDPGAIGARSAPVAACEPGRVNSFARRPHTRPHDRWRPGHNEKRSVSGLTTSIPGFDIDGLLPPIRPGAPGHSRDRAPYRTDALTFCQRFGNTDERRIILHGWLQFRLRLQETSLNDGFQWVNGSFCEDIEVQETRPPGDVDVVTLARLGDQLVLSRKLPPEVLDHDLCKETFHVDHYFVATDVPFSMDQGSMISYWSSLWSHRRADNRWKGFVAIPLASNDVEALAWLRQDIGAPQCGGGSP